MPAECSNDDRSSSAPARRSRLAALAAVLVGSLPFGPRSSHADDSGGGKSAKPLPRTFTLLIGCTEYPEIRKSMPNPSAYRATVALEGCVNDVDLMRRTLAEKFGASEISMLVGWDDAHEESRPTEKNVRAALERLAATEYRHGDRVIVHYSGHGVQQPDDGDDESDGLDEAWLLADGRKIKSVDAAGKPRDDYAGTLRDDELGARLRAIRDRGASVWCIMDCCHSATGTRGATDPQARTRGLDAAVVGIDLRPTVSIAAPNAHQGSPMDDASQGSEGLVVFYAAQSFQKVPEVRLPDDAGMEKSYGLLTTTVARGLRRCGRQLTFAELFEHVVAGYREMGRQNEVQPLSEGDIGRPVFDEGRGLSTPLFVRRIDARLELTAGMLNGLAEGTELDVFEPGFLGDAAHRLGRVVVSELRAEVSRVEPTEGSDAAWTKEAGPGRWPAEIATLTVGAASLPLALVDEAGRSVSVDAAAPRVREILGGTAFQARFPPAKSPARAKWLVVLDGEGEPITVAPAKRGRGADSFSVRMATLEPTLLGVFRGENLLGYSARDPGAGELPENLGLRIRRYDESGAKEKKLVASGQYVTPGTRLDLSLHKESASSSGDVDSMDVFVFWIDPHFGIYLIYPEYGDTGRLGESDVSRKGRDIPIGREDGEPTNDTSQGEERILVFAAPRRVDTPSLDLSFLEQPPLSAKARGVGASAAKLLEAVAFGPSERGVGSASRAETKLYSKVYTFRTRWGALRAPPEAGDAPTARIERAPAAAPAADAPPDAWRIGPLVRLARAGGRGAESTCMLVARADGAAGATNILVDLEGEVPRERQTKADLERIVTEASFRADLAVRLEVAPKRTIVWYDRDRDGRFDLVLLDADDDLRAEERFRLAGGRWTHEVGLDLDILSTQYFPRFAPAERSESDEAAEARRSARVQAIERLRTIAGD